MCPAVRGSVMVMCSVGMVAVGWWLDVVILEVSSNLNDPVMVFGQQSEPCEGRLEFRPKNDQLPPIVCNNRDASIRSTGAVGVLGLDCMLSHLGSFLSVLSCPTVRLIVIITALCRVSARIRITGAAVLDVFTA